MPLGTQTCKPLDWQKARLRPEYTWHLLTTPTRASQSRQKRRAGMVWPQGKTIVVHLGWSGPSTAMQWRLAKPQKVPCAHGGVLSCELVYMQYLSEAAGLTSLLLLVHC